MKLGPKLLIAVAGVLAACGTGREFPDAGPFDASGPQPIAVVRYLFDAGFAPATIAQDFDDNFVCADAQTATLHVLDADGLGELSVEQIAAGGWSNPQLSTGRAGQAFLTAHLDDGTNPVWAVDLGDDSVRPVFANAAGNGFHARRDGDGFMYASVLVSDAGLSPGPVVLIDGDGGVAAQFPMSDWVDDLASAPNGRLFASTFGDGGCRGVVVLGEDAGFAVDGGQVPCMLGLSDDSLTLWLSTSNDTAGTTLYQLDPRTLGLTGTWTIEDFTALFHSVVLAADGSVALLGAGPTNTLAIGRAAWLAQGGGFQVVPATQVPAAADAIFDEQNALYIADPAGHSVDEIR